MTTAAPDLTFARAPKRIAKKFVVRGVSRPRPEPQAPRMLPCAVTLFGSGGPYAVMMAQVR